MTSRPRHYVCDERGSVLVEVMVSAILVTIAAIGVFNAFDAATRSTAQERHRAQAHGLAQEDVARMRTMRISDLSNLNETRTEVVDGVSYTVKSVAEFQTDSTGTASCDEGTASADYIQIRSTVTWPSIGSRPPVVAQSLVAPPNGSVSPSSGALAVQIVNAQSVGIEGVPLSGSGPEVFSGSTGPNGCAIFGNLAAGNYTLAVSSGSLVDRDGNPPQQQATSVVAESTNTVVFQYDEPGQIPVAFQTRVGEELQLQPSSADSIVVFNTGMTLAKTFGSVGAPQATVTADSLFPFGSPYAVYAGSCLGNNPNPGGELEPPAAIADVLLTAGGVAPTTLELPALHLTVWNGSAAGELAGEPVVGAQIHIADLNCSTGSEAESEPVTRSFVTDESGGLKDPGLPWSEYDICAEAEGRHVEAKAVSVPADPEAMELGTDLDLYLTGAASETGECP